MPDRSFAIGVFPNQETLKDGRCQTGLETEKRANKPWHFCINPKVSLFENCVPIFLAKNVNLLIKEVK